MADELIKALLIEDDPGDAFFIQELFSDSSGSESIVQFTHADCLASGIDQLKKKIFDVILLDLSLPDSQGVETFDKLYSVRTDVPIVILTGLNDKHTAVSMLQRGAQDYLIKGGIDRDLLERPIRYAIERHQLVRTLDEQKKKIEDSEKYYRSLLNRLHEDVVVIDRNYNVTDINNTLLHATGHERSDAIGQKCYTLFHGFDSPCDCNGKTCLLQKVFEEGQFVSFVNQFTKKSGEAVWGDIVLSPLKGNNGQVTHVIETVRDITDILKTKENLSKTEQRYFQLLNSLNEGVWVLDKDGNTEFVTPRMAQLLGYTKEEMLGKPLLAFIKKQDTDLCKAFLEKRKQRIQDIHDFVFLRKDQSEMAALIATTPLYNESGDYAGCLGGVLDITQRKNAESQLRQSERMYQSLVDNLPVCVFRKDLHGRFTFVNSGMREALGKPVEEILGKTDYDFYKKPLAEKYRKDDLQVIQSLHLFETEEKNTPADGQEIEVNVIKTPILDQDGKCIGIQGISWDITEKKKLQEQLLQSQKMEAIGQLAGGVAHDFNNILMVIKSYSEFALKQLPEDSKLNADILEIKNAGNRAAALTRQLLAFSRRQVVQPLETKLNEILENMDKMLRRLIGEDIELVAEIDPDLGFIKIDPGQAEQVIMNLAVNARDAMPDGGKLTIAVRNEELLQPYENQINIVPPGDYVQLVISDNGTGMNKETQQHIFEPFYTTKEQGKGTGLGLSTVYGIIKQNHGYLTLQSQPGEGTKFNIYFPRVDLDKELECEHPKDFQILRGPETILVVEDDELVRKIIKRSLMEYGYNILTAKDGDEAIRICSEYSNTIHVLLTDVVMPGMNGRELTDKIQRIIPGIKYAYMSGYTDDAIVRLGVLEQGNVYIQKPFTQETVIRKIRNLLDNNTDRYTDCENLL